MLLLPFVVLSLTRFWTAKHVVLLLIGWCLTHSVTVLIFSVIFSLCCMTVGSVKWMTHLCRLWRPNCTLISEKSKFLPKPHGPVGGADLRFHTLSQTPAYTARPQMWTSASRDVPVCALIFTPVAIYTAWWLQYMVVNNLHLKLLTDSAIPGVDLATTELQVQCLTISLPSHQLWYPRRLILY